MSVSQSDSNVRPDFDKVITDIIDYVYETPITSGLAFETARYCLMDTLGCAMLALNFDACRKLLGPLVPGITITGGARIPGLDYQCDPVQAAFDIGTLVRWLDFNDTWLAAEWGHPSDNLGAILACSDYISRARVKQGEAPLTMHDVLTMMVKAHEIQGVLALENSFNSVGLDHVILVKVASTAVAAKIMGASREQAQNALSLAFVDGQSLRTYRHAPNAGSRKSWAAGDATSRAVRLVLIAMTGEMGYPSALSAKTWGFYDVLFKGKPFTFQRDYESYVMENVLFKISFPAEFHAQTAVEAAVILHEQVKDNVDNIESIHIRTQDAAVRIISKTGPLYNPADRDHCLQYMVAIGLIYGDLEAKHYEDDVASDPRIDQLRDKMVVTEEPSFTKDYFDPEKRAITNALTIKFKDGTETDEVLIEYPIGHRLRREEGIPKLIEKCEKNLRSHFDINTVQRLMAMMSDKSKLEDTAVNIFVDAWVSNNQ